MRIFLAVHIRRSYKRLLVKCVSVLLSIAVCLVNVPLSYAAFESMDKAAFTASVTIGGAIDTDYDGLDDAWENLYGLDIDNPEDAYDDNDSDGINNLEEYRLDKHPRNKNSTINAGLSTTPSSGYQPLEIALTASPTIAQNADIVKYEWDFDGNGTYDQWCYATEGNTAVYRYTASGAYNAKVRVTDSSGRVDVAAATVDIQRDDSLNPPLVLTEIGLAPPMNLTITSVKELRGSASDNIKVTRYQWDTTGDGEYDISSSKSPNITKTFNEVRTRSYVSSLKVTDTDGLSDIASVGIDIDAREWNDLPNKPKVYLDEYVVYGIAGVAVSLKGYGAPFSLGHAKKLEWDFESDGISDWSCSEQSPDWKEGHPEAINHIYGAPGIYRATLKVHTEATLTATDSVLVIISEPVNLHPNAQAAVSYNGTVDAASINGIIPVQAAFKHSASSSGSGAITKYEWDFDGDKRIDYVTTNSADTPGYVYKFPGYCVAMLRVTNSNGLIDTFYIPVSTSYPIGYSSYIKQPKNNQVIAGNSITLCCEVFPDDAAVSEVMFQYRALGSVLWTNIGLGSPLMSYATTWDTTTLTDGTTYEVRAIVNGADSAAFKINSFIVNNSVLNPDVYENNDGTNTKKERLNPDESNLVVLSDGTQIDIPSGAIADNTTTPVIKVSGEPNFRTNIGDAIGITIENQPGYIFTQDITITMFYPDADNNGIVDGTSTWENDLKIQWHNPDTNKWEPIYDSVVYPDENYICANVNHLSIFGLIGVLAAAIGGGTAVAASKNSSASYCFIATAAYGTPMAKEVVVLREFRDKYLLTNTLGRRFVEFYYKNSPPAAEFISKRPVLRAISRVMLKPLVDFAKSLLRHSNKENIQ